MKLLLQRRCVVLARLSVIPALVLRCVQIVANIQTELLGLRGLQIVSIYFEYNYI